MLWRVWIELHVHRLNGVKETSGLQVQKCQEKSDMSAFLMMCISCLGVHNDLGLEFCLVRGQTHKKGPLYILPLILGPVTKSHDTALNFLLVLPTDICYVTCMYQNRSWNSTSTCTFSTYWPSIPRVQSPPSSGIHSPVPAVLASRT